MKLVSLKRYWGQKGERNSQKYYQNMIMHEDYEYTLFERKQMRQEMKRMQTKSHKLGAFKANQANI